MGYHVASIVLKDGSRYDQAGHASDMNERMTFADAMKARLAEAELGQATVVGASPEGQPFGNATAVFRLDGMLLRFVRDRGQAFLELAVESAPAEFHQYDDIEIAMGWKTIDEVLGKREPEGLGAVLSRLRVHLAELKVACSGDRAELTTARFKRAARERGKAFTDRLRGKMISCRKECTGVPGSIEISDPWDFPQLGRIPVVVLAFGPDEALVRFATPVAYQGRTFTTARLNPRHEGGQFAPAAPPLPVNVALLQHDPGERTKAQDDPQQPCAIGTFRLD